MKGQFVNAVTVRLPLVGVEDERWIEIRSMLPVGLQKKIEASGVKNYSPSGDKDVKTFGVDLSAFSFTRTLAYVTDWNLVDQDGRSVPFTEAAMLALDGEVYEAIETAITGHIEAQAAEKKRQAGS